MKNATRFQNGTICASISWNAWRTMPMALMISLGILSGCATNTTKTEGLAAEKMLNEESGARKDLMPKQMAFTAMFDLLNCWPHTKKEIRKNSGVPNQIAAELSCPVATNYDVTGLYTRLHISSDWPKLLKPDGTPDPEVNVPARERRGVLQRALFGKTSTRILTLKATVAEHGFATVVPLLSVGHVSNREVGEQFDVMATDSGLEGPFFKIGAATKLSVAVEARTSTQYSSNSVKAVLGIAKRAVEYAAPQSSLLTSLTKEKASVGATAMDDAISKLTGDQEKEEVRAEADISRWDASYSMRVSGRLPGEKPDDSLLEGQWWVSLAIPRVSIFSSVEACKLKSSKVVCTEETVQEARKRVFSNNLFLPAVLGLQVAENVRLYDYLARQTWFGDAMGQLGADGSAAEKVASRFCANIVDSVYGLGLNHEDALATLYAVIKTRLDKKQVLSVRNNCTGYVEHLGKLGLNI